MGIIIRGILKACNFFFFLHLESTFVYYAPFYICSTFSCLINAVRVISKITFSKKQGRGSISVFHRPYSLLASFAPSYVYRNSFSYLSRHDRHVLITRGIRASSIDGRSRLNFSKSPAHETGYRFI